MAQTTDILVFEDVTLPATEAYEHVVSGLSFTLGPGEAWLVEVEDDLSCPPIADAAMGLLQPEAGTVRFLEREWTERAPDEVAAARSRIGRVFESRAWVSNLDVDENVTLARRHHGDASDEAVYAEARALADRFNGMTLPASRPAVTGRHDLVIAQWVRALLGDPVLLLLERPTSDVSADDGARLIEAVRERLAAGGAALWLTGDNRILQNQSLNELKRARIAKGKWETCG